MNRKSQQIIVASCYDKRGYLLSTAVNSYTKTHPKQAYHAAKVGHPLRCFLHAEIAAIIKAKGKKIHKMKVERFGKRGNLLPSHPCPICMSAIKAASINCLEYTVC